MNKHNVMVVSVLLLLGSLSLCSQAQSLMDYIPDDYCYRISLFDIKGIEDYWTKTGRDIENLNNFYQPFPESLLPQCRHLLLARTNDEAVVIVAEMESNLDLKTLQEKKEIEFSGEKLNKSRLLSFSGMYQNDNKGLERRILLIHIYNGSILVCGENKKDIQAFLDVFEGKRENLRSNPYYHDLFSFAEDAGPSKSFNIMFGGETNRKKLHQDEKHSEQAYLDQKQGIKYICSSASIKEGFCEIYDVTFCDDSKHAETVQQWDIARLGLNRKAAVRSVEKQNQNKKIRIKPDTEGMREFNTSVEVDDKAVIVTTRYKLEKYAAENRRIAALRKKRMRELEAKKKAREKAHLEGKQSKR